MGKEDEEWCFGTAQWQATSTGFFCALSRAKEAEQTGTIATIVTKRKTMGAKTGKKHVEVIYEDDEILVINKPSGVSVTKDRTGAAELSEVLGEQPRAERVRLRLVHRLDKDTSGVMILAKDLRAQTEFSAYFEHRLVAKTYLALVSGPVATERGTIDSALAPSPGKTTVMRVVRRGGKEAVTEWELLADFGHVVLLAVHPLTGRTHQIRVHMASAQMPLAIDPLYGGGTALFLSDFKQDYRLGKGRSEKPLIERLTLHAYQIRLPQPQMPADVVSGASAIQAAISPRRPYYLIAALDKKFAATIKMLTRHNPKGIQAFINREHFYRIMNGSRL